MSVRREAVDTAQQGAPLAEWRWRLAVAAVILAALVLLYGRVWMAGGRTHTLSVRQEPVAQSVTMSDHRFVVWMVARNARALVSDPLHYFDGEACFPSEHSVVLGEPMVTMGILGIPPLVVSGDPELTYNVVIAAMTAFGMLGMFLLVADWTAQPLAGLVAAVFYAFGAPRLVDPVHPFIGDLSWMVFALFFARRLFFAGRWRDALGVSLSLTLQMGTGAYPMVASALLGLPFFCWLLLRYGASRPGWAVILLVPVLPAAMALFMGLPFLEAGGGHVLTDRTNQFFLHPVSFVAAVLSPGWLGSGPLLVLAAIGLILPRRVLLRESCRDPRWALLAGAGLCLAAAMGPVLSQLLGLGRDANLWAVLGALIPPLAFVRVPGVTVMGLSLVMQILGGIGFAGIVTLTQTAAARSTRRVAALVFATVAMIAVIVEAVSGLASAGYEPVLLQPQEEQVAFFRELERLGNRGPIFEWPSVQFAMVHAWRASLVAYHRRPTSTCLASYAGPRHAELMAISRRLPDQAALFALRSEGFTTLLVHHDAASRAAMTAPFDTGTAGEFRMLRYLHGIDSMTAYSLEPAEIATLPPASPPAAR